MKEVTPALIEGCIKGDRKSQTALYAIVFPVLMGMSRRYFINEDDRTIMVNNSYLKLINSLPKYQNEGSIEAWCRRIMTNTIIDAYRSNKRWRTTIELKETWTKEEVNYYSENHAQNHTAEGLEAMLLRLPDATRCVFNLFAIEGYGHKEIAAMLKVSEGTSKWHVAKAREQLKGMLRESNIKAK